MSFCQGQSVTWEHLSLAPLLSGFALGLHLPLQISDFPLQNEAGEGKKGEFLELKKKKSCDAFLLLPKILSLSLAFIQAKPSKIAKSKQRHSC